VGAEEEEENKGKQGMQSEHILGVLQFVPSRSAHVKSAC